MAEQNKTCIIISCHANVDNLLSQLDMICSAKMGVFLIDDNNNERDLSHIKKGIAGKKQIVLLINKKPFGRGSAFRRGIEHASYRGYDRGILMDASVQMDKDSFEGLVHHAVEINKNNLICGVNRVGLDNAVSRFWLKMDIGSVESEMSNLSSVMVLPLNAARKILTKHDVGQGLNFSAEMLVRMYWAGIDYNIRHIKISEKSQESVMPLEDRDKFRSSLPMKNISMYFEKVCHMGRITRREYF